MRTKEVAIVEDLGNFEQLLGMSCLSRLPFFLLQDGSCFASRMSPATIVVGAGSLSFSTPITKQNVLAVAAIGPGLHFVLCPLKSIVGRLSLRIQQLDVLCETKTKGTLVVRFFFTAVHGHSYTDHGLTFLTSVLFYFCLDNVFVQVRLILKRGINVTGRQ